MVFLFHFALAFFFFPLSYCSFICFHFHFCVFAGFLEVLGFWGFGFFVLFLREKEEHTVGEVGKWGRSGRNWGRGEM